jgi:tetratricopeptide (TPR) repeat protein
MNTIRNCFVWGLLLVLLSLATGCGNRQTAAVLDDVETYIQDRPDSALAALRAIDTTTLNSRRLHAQYALLHSMALDKNWIDTTDVNVVMPAVAYYDRRRPVSRRAKPYYYLGRIQYNGGRYDEAILSFTRAREYAEGLEDDRFKAMVFHAMGDTYNMSYLFEEAYAMSDSSYQYCLKTGDTVLTNIALFQVAQNLNNLKCYQDAVSIYDTLVNDPSVQTNHNLFGRVLSGYALAVINDTQDYEKARKLYERCLANGGRFDNLTHWGAYAYSLANVGEVEKAKRIFNQLEGRYGEQYAYQAWKSRMERLQGNLPEAYALLESSSERQTDRTREILSQSVVKAQRDYYFLQKESLQKENRMRKTINLFMALFIISAFIAATIAIRRYQEKERRHNQDLIEAVQDLMEKNNGLKLEYIHLGQENYKALSDLCNTYYRTEGRTSQANAVCGEVRGYLKTLGVGESRYPALEQRVNEQFGDIMKHFRQEHPNHREPFYQTACYLFAGFKSRTIALILNQDEQNTYKTKSLLRKEIETEATPHQKEFLLLLDGASR